MGASPTNLFGAWVGKGGPQPTTDGTPGLLRLGKDGAECTQDAHARYQEAVYRGNVYYANNTAAQALSVASSTYTGLVISNPVNNLFNFVMLEAIFAGTIVETGIGAIVLGWGSSQTAGVPLVLTTGNSSGPTGVSAKIGGSQKSTALVGASCTFAVLGAAAAPTILRPLQGIQWITAVSQANLYVKDEIAGSLILTPGSTLCIEAITTATTGLAYFSWEEIPV